jgi:ribose transport system substrate-binding protein
MLRRTRAFAQVIAPLATAFALFSLQGCNNSNPPAASGGAGPTTPPTSSGPASKKTIGVSVLTLENPFFKIMGDAMVEEGKKNGFGVIVTAGEKDPARQKDQVSDFITKKVSAIVLCPCDSRSVGTAIAAANTAGIPVFTADIASLDTASKVVSHIATDNYSGGKLAGKAMIEAMTGGSMIATSAVKGKVAIIDFPEAESVQQRTKGFKEALAATPHIQIVAQLDGRATRDDAYKVAQDILQKNPDLTGIFCINDPTAFGAIAAVEKAGRQGKVKIISFDGQLEAKQAVKDGKIYAEPIQYPDKIGQMTIQSIVKYMAGEKVPPQTLIPTTLYTKEDADKDPALAKAR